MIARLPSITYRVEVRGITTANHFPAGHRIQVEIAGTDFPNFDRNWHTGGRNELATDGPVAHLTLHHGEQHPSRLRYRAYLPAVESNPAGQQVIEQDFVY